MSAPSLQDQRRSGIARKLALFFAVLIALLALLELAVRTRQYVKLGSFGPMHQFVRDPESGLEIPPPGRVTAHFTINELGFRGPMLQTPKPADRLRLAFLGASTTFCAEATSEEKTWPALVSAALATDRPSGGVDYLNAGVGGYTLDQIQTNLEKRVAAFDPDVIFYYEATNDLTRDTREFAIAQNIFKGHADRESWLGRHSIAWYLVEKNLLQRTRIDEAAKQQETVKLDPRELSRKYRTRLEAFCDAAAARAKLVVLLTFSIQARREQDPARRFEACSTAFYYMPYMTPELFLDSFDEYNRVIREVAAEKNALLVDVALAVPGDRVHFNDSVHFKDQGCAVFATAVTEALRASPRWNALVGR